MAGSEGALTGRIVGAHQVGDLIGAGPLAEVYQARHPGMVQLVALKVFAPGVVANSAYVETMRDIVGQVRLLEADHILPVYDFGRDGEHLFLSMPLMHESLRAALRRAACLPLYRAVPLVRDIASGLATAHAAGIIHRDLKPENVLLDGSGKAYISDFGIGRDLPPDSIERHSLSTLSSLIGTPAYMAPEQLRGQPTDQRSDVYALGVIFYEMLTGMPPFSGNTIYEVAAQALTKRIPPPSQHVSGTPALVERAILRSLARDPAARWPTVQRFMVGLNAALPGRTSLSDGPAIISNGPAPMTATARLTPTLEGVVPGIVDEASPDDVPTTKVRDRGSNTNSRDFSGSSSAIRVPDLRLFRVDPLPPASPDQRPARLVLVGAALLLLGVLIVGGALLANAAQSSNTNRGMPTSPSATQVPTQGDTGTLVTQPPFVQPTATPAPKPTAPYHPASTPTPKPTATAAPIPTATSTATSMP